MLLDEAALDNNIAVMAAWVAERGLLLAPHGKTTMAPEIWRRQLDAGAWAITVANSAQLRVAIDEGVQRIVVANELLDAPALRETQQRLAADPALEVFSWVDSLEAVELMAASLDPAGPPWDLLVELGGMGARTGARDDDNALRVAEAIVASPVLRSRGVGGYEGAVAHGRAPESLATVRDYLARMAGCFTRLLDAGLIEGTPVLSAGGSTYPDLVAEAFAGLTVRGVAVVLRSGSYVAHDHGVYEAESPIPGLRSAMYVWARVLSRPEPGLALLDAGRRDLSFDAGLPIPQLAAAELGGPGRELRGAEVVKLNDQHAHVHLDPHTELRVGEYVRLGLSHPCTVFDKWREMPLVRDGEIVQVVETRF